MANFRKLDAEDTSIKPTCSSHGPSSRNAHVLASNGGVLGTMDLRNGISPATNEGNSRNMSAGFRPVHSHGENVPFINISNRKNELLGSIVSSSNGSGQLLNL